MGKWLFVCLISVVIAGCQTSQVNQFSKVQNGMDKSQVLELVGSPQSKIRRNGIDRWTYTFFENEEWHSKDVQLDQGLVVYVGPRMPEPVSAAEQDKINDDHNAELDKKDEERKRQSQKAFSDYESEISAPKSIRYAPIYTPID